MKRDPSSYNKRSWPPEVVPAIDAALSDLEKQVPGISGDLQVRGEVEAAVGAALVSLEHVVPQATEAVMRRTMEKAFKSKKDPSDAAMRKAMEEALKSKEDPSDAATRKAVEKASRSRKDLSDAATRRWTSLAALLLNPNNFPSGS